MAKFHTRSVEVDAWQLGAGVAPAFITAAIDGQTIAYRQDADGKRHMRINARGGIVRAEEGDWVIMSDGEFDAVKPDVFAANFEAVDDGPRASPAPPWGYGDKREPA